MHYGQAVGVIGGYGAVGSAAVRRLQRAGIGPLLIAGRDPARAAALLASLDRRAPAPATMAVDVDEPASLDRFAARCQAIVNCAGPSYRLLDTVAQAALRHGIHYIDAAGDDPARNRLCAHGRAGEWIAAQRTAVFSAGALPGLSGLLPRVLLARAAHPSRLDAYLGGVAPLTPAAAADVLLSRGPEHGTPGASWQGDRIRERTLTPHRAVRLEGFPRPVNAFPFLSTEAARFAAAARVEQLRWYTVFGGVHLAEELTTAWAMGTTETASLISAAAVDVREHGAWYGQEFHLWDGTPDGPPTSALVLRADDSYELSGFLTAEATRRTLDGAVAPGVHFAADVLDPLRTAESLSADPAAELHIR